MTDEAKSEPATFQRVGLLTVLRGQLALTEFTVQLELVRLTQMAPFWQVNGWLQPVRLDKLARRVVEAAVVVQVAVLQTAAAVQLQVLPEAAGVLGAVPVAGDQLVLGAAARFASLSFMMYRQQRLP